MALAAEAWLAAKGLLPKSLAELVGTSALEHAHFEHPVRVFGTGTSMTDVMAFVPNEVIAIEAKRLETFDEEVREWIYKKRRRTRAHLRSGRT
jgi:hypothetical protein